MENNYSFLKKLNTEVPYDPAVPLLDIYLKKSKTLIQKYTCAPRFLVTSFTIGEAWKLPKCSPRDKQIKKGWVRSRWKHRHTRLASSHNHIKVTTEIENNHHSTVRNRVEWKSDNYRVKETTSIETGRRGADTEWADLSPMCGG